MVDRVIPNRFAPAKVGQAPCAADVTANIEQGALLYLTAQTSASQELAESFLAEVMGTRGIRGYVSPWFGVVRVGRQFRVWATEEGAEYMAFASDPLDGQELGRGMKGRWE